MHIWGQFAIDKLAAAKLDRVQAIALVDDPRW
jgi:hypothetical protein